MGTRQQIVSPPASVDTSGRSGVQQVLAQVWAHASAPVGLTLATAVLSGIVVGLIMPRGPVTTAQALLLMAIGLLTGIAAGISLRSRWAMLLAPTAQVAAFELTRLGERGVTVDGISLGSMYGVLAFVLGRGVYGLLGLLPMVLGVAYGVAIARRLTVTEPERHGVGVWVRRGIGGLTTLGLVALAIWIALPASVPPVRGADGEVIAGSVAELTKVSIGGNEQWLEIRGASPDLPVLLYLSGGPGQSDLAFSRALFADLTRDFLVVGWDQRGNGKSYADWDATAMTLNQAVTDTIEVTSYLRQRFDEEKIYLLGESWGSTLAVLAAQRQPELYYALIGSGQMVSQRETDQMIFQDLLAYAEEQGNVELATSLRAYGPPPYATLWANVLVMEHYDALADPYTPPQIYIARGEGAQLGFYGILGSEYTAIEKINVLRGLIETFEVMYPQLQSIDFRTDVPALDVPLYLLVGEHELRGRRELADEWFALLDAPDKQMFRYENAGHSVAFEQADELHRILLEVILPTTRPDA